MTALPDTDSMAGGASPGGGDMERLAEEARADIARSDSQAGQSLPSQGSIAGGTLSKMVS